MGDHSWVPDAVLDENGEWQVILPLPRLRRLVWWAILFGAINGAGLMALGVGIIYCCTTP